MPLAMMLLTDSFSGGHVAHALSLSSVFFIMAIISVIIAAFIMIEIYREITRELNHFRQHPVFM
jgi:positive regulator of sigma E activity